MPNADRPEPIRLVNVSLLLWGSLVSGLCVPYMVAGGSWGWVGIALGGITVGIAIWGLRRREWIRPLFTSLYVLAVGSVVAGPLADSDVWPGVGIACITILSVGATILHRLGGRD